MLNYNDVREMLDSRDVNNLKEHGFKVLGIDRFEKEGIEYTLLEAMRLMIEEKGEMKDIERAIRLSEKLIEI